MITEVYRLLWTGFSCLKGVSIHWTGLLDWNTGLDYWTDLLNHKRQFPSVN